MLEINVPVIDFNKNICEVNAAFLVQDNINYFSFYINQEDIQFSSRDWINIRGFKCAIIRIINCFPDPMIPGDSTPKPDPNIAITTNVKLFYLFPLFNKEVDLLFSIFLTTEEECEEFLKDADNNLEKVKQLMVDCGIKYR